MGPQLTCPGLGHPHSPAGEVQFWAQVRKGNLEEPRDQTRGWSCSLGAGGLEGLGHGA